MPLRRNASASRVDRHARKLLNRLRNLHVSSNSRKVKRRDNRIRSRRSVHNNAQHAVDDRVGQSYGDPIDLTKSEVIAIDDDNPPVVIAIDDAEAEINEEYEAAWHIGPEVPDPVFGPAAEDMIEIDGYPFGDGFLKAGDCVELIDGTFLLTRNVFQQPTSKSIAVQGLQLLLSEVVMFIDSHPNELIFKFNSCQSDGRHVEAQNLIIKVIDEVKQLRTLIRTNAPFPAHSSQNHFTVRWKMVVTYADIQQRRQHESAGESGRLFALKEVLCLDEAECSEGCNVDLKAERRKWRGPTQQGGSSASADGTRKYTLADYYGGGGGIACGAKQAGLEVKFMIDFDQDAVTTYKHHQLQADVYYQDISSHVTDKTEEFKADIAHLSPPCPTFSPANPLPQEKKVDSPNYAVIYASADLILKQRPRVVTLEETFGILHREWTLVFGTIIRSITRLGFSISWQVVDCSRYRVPQTRQRLIILASCPGETLPTLPNDRLGVITPKQVLDQIPRNARHHDVEAVLRGVRCDRRWDPHTPGETLTTQGTTKGHWDGGRKFTIRELAALQTFPHDYVFVGQKASVTRQIGNAVPPAFAKIMFEGVKQHLQIADGLA